MARAASVLLVLAALLAGCGSQSPSTQGIDVDQVADTVDVRATDATGVIRCVVVDEAIQPIAGATVRLEPTGRETPSAANGGCGFEGLEPGSYFVEGYADGFREARAVAHVVAGVSDPKPVLLILERDSASAYFDTFAFTNSFDIVIAINQHEAYSLCPSCTTPSQHGMRLDRNATWLQAEMVWTPSSPLSNELLLVLELHRGGDVHHRAVVEGPSMLPSVLTERDLELMHIVKWRVSGASLEPLPVGAAASQTVDIYVSVFYNMLPRSGWFFTVDGEHPAP